MKGASPRNKEYCACDITQPSATTVAIMTITRRAAPTMNPPLRVNAPLNSALGTRGLPN